MAGCRDGSRCGRGTSGDPHDGAGVVAAGVVRTAAVHHKWPIFVPIIMFAAAIANLFTTDWSQFDASFLLALVALGVLVSFSEELMARVWC